jgi:predicted transcriptional regulator
MVQLKTTHKVRADVFLEPEINEKITNYAIKKQIPRSRIIEMAVKEYVERHKEEFEK